MIVVGVAGCCDGPRSWHTTSDGRIIADQWSSALPELGQRNASHPLRYDVLYVAEVRNPDRAWRWHRFWPGGQVHSGGRHGENPPTAADGDDFRRFSGERYCVVGDRLVIEGIGPSENFFCRFQYSREVSRINEDGSFTLAVYQGLSEGLDRRYEYWTFRPTEVGRMTRAPDW